VEVKIMDDKFLYQLQEEPNPEFVKKLHQTLTQVVPNPNPKRRLTMNIPTLTILRKTKWAWIVAGAALGLVLFATTSPARALISSLIEIAGQSFTVTDDYPGDNEPGEPTIIEPQVLSLADALAAFPYDVHLPTYAPAGYTLEEDNVWVFVGEGAGEMADHMRLFWKNSNNMGPDSVEEIFLDADHSAALVRGGWNYNEKKWSDAYGELQLTWTVGELTYHLSGTDIERLRIAMEQEGKELIEVPGAVYVDLDELIQIASSTLE
jgi:hypothetical protein